MITYNAEGVRMPKIKKRMTTAWIRHVAANYGKKVGEVGYLFCDDEKILEVNREYLGHDYYTDIITFDYSEDDVINGDLVISLDTVHTNAEKFGKDYDEELHRVIIHGILHLCGINDKGPGEREQMEMAENMALVLLHYYTEDSRNTLMGEPVPMGYIPSSNEGID
ncbi:MAG: rRNA maturation RNase YbeY [Prevotella sp.]|nr:rRNA maturation RNase YbeY [Prevotella sp.]